MNNKKKLLLQNELFSELDDEGFNLIAGYSETQEYNPGDIVFKEGDSDDTLYILISGAVQILKKDTENNNIVIAELTQGDTLGELDFFTQKSRNTTCVSIEKTVLLHIPAKGFDLRKIFDDYPEISSAVLYNFLRIYSNRLRKANTLIKDNSALMQELKRQVYGDKLTGLYNKTYLEETLPDFISNRSNPAALLLMKPDNFKMINDTFGHDAGDNTLKIMAAALNRFTGDKGIVLRYMGNELGVLLPGVNREDALHKAREILEMFKSLDISEAIGVSDVFLSMSIGIALYPEHADIADDLITKAHEIPLIGRERGGNIILFPEDI